MNIALILAGGQGTRMAQNEPKQFMKINGKPLLAYSLLAFENHTQIDDIFVVSDPKYREQIECLADEYGISKFGGVICGGQTRQDSSRGGIFALKDIADPTDIVLIHDAARPNISEEIISNNIALASKFGACETAFPTTDTIAIASDNSDAPFVQSIPKRSTLWNTQTPQSFRYEVILRAHEILQNQTNEITDDAGLIIQSGLSKEYPVAIAMGSASNIKVTRPEDIPLIESLLR